MRRDPPDASGRDAPQPHAVAPASPEQAGGSDGLTMAAARV